MPSEPLKTATIGGMLVIVDDAPPSGEAWPPEPSKLEWISWEAGLDPDVVRRHLRAEVDRLSRERAARYERANRYLDLKVALAAG